MNKLLAKNIIEKHSLISRKISKIILKNIRDDNSYEVSLKPYISEIEFYNIKKNYNEKLSYLKKEKIEITPKNLPFLYIIKDIDDNFKWKINEPSSISKNNTDLVIETSNVEGLNPSFSSIMLNLVNKELHKKSAYPNFLENNIESKSLILDLFEDVKFASNLSKINTSLSKCINKSIKDKCINILTPLCPDYANINLGKGFYTLTFDGLKSEIGVTAKKLLENLDSLHSVFNRRKIRVSHLAAIGDFEALSDDTCRRVNLTRNEFIEKLKISQFKLKKKVGNKLDTILFTDLCNGFDNWIKIHSKFYKMLINNDFGDTNITIDQVKLICESRKPLLYRWFGKISDEELLKIVLWQGAEYATMGFITNENLDNALIIGADHFKMAPFYALGSNLPILYLTSNYMRN